MRRRPPAVARVLERVTATARGHRMFESGETVLVACSGGPDSTCLLHALVMLRRLLRIRPGVFHFDHGLRKESADDAAYVARQADRLGLELVARKAEDRPRRGQSVEAWARLARYAALGSAAVDVGASRAAVGHTLDDQAETVLLGLVRGGGLEAVSGMDAVATLPPLGLVAVRPLLDVTREETLAFCRSLRLRPRQDPMNRDPRFLRNRIRRALPELERRLDRNLRGTLVRTAENVRADAEYLDALASAAARETVSVSEEEIRLDARTLAGLPEPLALRVVQQALRAAAAGKGEWESDVTSAHVRSVLDLATGRPGRRADLPGPLMAKRDREYVRVTSPEASHAARSRGRGTSKR